tara:strand:+ start:1562 stop:2044 length:483 start_codon:yes stop_codon:yes gene_type:complete
MPQGLLAATPAPTSKTRISDVVLGTQGTLSGQLVDAQGHALAGRIVMVRRGAKLIAKARTDAKGQFAVKNLPGGPYAVTSGSAHQVIRAWAAGSAPPRTASQIVLVDRRQLIRGQDEAATDGLLGMSTAGLLVVGGAATAVAVLVAESDDDAPASPPASP